VFDWPLSAGRKNVTSKNFITSDDIEKSNSNRQNHWSSHSLSLSLSQSLSLPIQLPLSITQKHHLFFTLPQSWLHTVVHCGCATGCTSGWGRKAVCTTISTASPRSEVGVAAGNRARLRQNVSTVLFAIRFVLSVSVAQPATELTDDKGTLIQAELNRP
jgi:hypothetical protein